MTQCYILDLFEFGKKKRIINDINAIRETSINTFVLFLGILYQKIVDKNPTKYGSRSKYPDVTYVNPNLLK